jgi:hypothetical protein
MNVASFANSALVSRTAASRAQRTASPLDRAASLELLKMGDELRREMPRNGKVTRN